MNHNHSRQCRTLCAMRTIVVASVVIAVGLAGENSIALAHQGSAPALPANREASVWPAPVGHRQPTPADLPPSMRRDEGATSPGQRDFDRSLDICRDC